MNRILFTAAAGALAMYFLDPQGGRRRRVRTRDKAEHVARRIRDAYDVTLRDTRHRAMGIKAMGRRILRRGPVDDETLAGRVRAVLGRYVSHPHAVEVTVSDGEVGLAGPILAHEVPGLMRAVKHVDGVRRVSNQLVVHKEPGNVSFDYYENGQDPNEFAIIETFADGAAGAAHVATEHASTFFAWMPAMITTKPLINYQDLDGDAWSEMAEVSPE